ncbi:MAG: hypothetical protein CXR31_00340 [Geobacter sp.]|nr:MAG: hypothetical protein CXR31_00340 [Geobacter sp.]
MIYRIMRQMFSIDAKRAGLEVLEFSSKFWHMIGVSVLGVLVANVHDLETGMVVNIIKEEAGFFVHVAPLALLTADVELNQGALTMNQRLFIEDAEKAGLTIDYDYSGKFMNGYRCPAVYVDSYHQVETDAYVCMDNWGKRFVVYAMI